jgi:hypothetical protein
LMCIAYLLSGFVLGAGGAHVMNSHLTIHGRISLTNPTQLFGMTENMYRPNFPVAEIK